MFYCYSSLRIHIFLQILLCSIITNADHLLRYKRAIGGESLDTSNFILYIDPDGGRFIEVPREYMNNWLEDQKMWRRWSIILAVLCFIFFSTLVFFLIYGFCTSSGPFSNCTKYFNTNSSSIMVTSNDNMPTLQQTFLVDSHDIPRLQSAGQLQSK